MENRLFRYYRDDFGPPPVRVIHMDLVFDVFDDHTRVTSDLHAESPASPLSALALNAKNLEILAAGCPGHACSSRYDPEKSLLEIRFGDPLPPSTRFTIHTETVCRPTANILEGLYYDQTPPGAPPQQITQCQQWGFQRLVPCIDEMTAKCTYTTTIIADERYTHLITNGDVSVARSAAGNGRSAITFGNLITPMAPYLFLLCCGTFRAFSRECEYPGGKRFALELLVPPASDPQMAESALDMLYDAVIWVYLFTGPDRYSSPEIRKRMYALLTRLGRIRKAGLVSPQMHAIRTELSDLALRIVPGYAYTGSSYREIAMQNSDYGGMENVGNTTITANRIMPYTAMTDPAYEYLVRVKAHEYYHNLNGSEVTGMSPFEIWLNEAVTVHAEEKYHAFHFGEEYSRLQTFISLQAPGSGTFDLDSGAASLPIEPEGFSDPAELITDITYRKAPEFVRMVETLMGREAFARGLDLYHRRYRYGNATRADWVMAMEEVSGQEFSQMADGWLRQTGFPTLVAQAGYDPARGVLTLRLRQTADRPQRHWIFPVRIGLVSRDGHDLAEVLPRLDNDEVTLEVAAPERPAFISINRGGSFYGKVSYDPPRDEVFLQAEKDPDLVGRYRAFTALMDGEKLKMLADPGAAPDPACLDLWFRCISDQDLMERAGGQFLTIPESVPDLHYAHRYQALHDVRERFLAAIASRYRVELLELCKAPVRADSPHDTIGKRAVLIKARQRRNAALAALSRLGTPEMHRVIREAFTTASCATDRLVAFSLYLDSTAADRGDLLAAFEAESAQHPVSWENFLSAVAANSSPELPDLVARVEASPAFRIEQANDQRALYGGFALNRKRSLQTVEGRALLSRILVRLAGINEHSTVMMMRVFGALEAMETADQVPLVGLLAGLLRDLDPATTPVVCNTARRILAESPLAVRAYEKSGGTLPPAAPHPAG